jgi:hypothetical protein
VLSKLLALPSTWEQLQRTLERGIAAPEGAKSVVALLAAAACAADERVLVAAAPRLERCVAATAALPQGCVDPSALGALVAALVARLPTAAAARADTSSALHALRAAATRASMETPWLELPLVPTVADVRDCPRWLTPGRLIGLESSYSDAPAYLERLFRMLRADVLADMSNRLLALSRGAFVHDRDLRRFTHLRVEGYRARGSALQIALSFTPATKPRGGGSVEFMDGSLVSIAPRGLWRDVGALLWAVVVGGEFASEALEENVVVVELLCGAGTDDVDALRALLAAPEGAPQMAENPVFFTAARFALERLQALGAGVKRACEPSLPFEDELVRTAPRRAEGFSKNGDAAKWEADLGAHLPAIRGLEFFEHLDVAQKHTIEGALQNRVWASQGPPGTGKTTASVALFSALRALPPGVRSDQPVLMLSVKNHALDQFLARIIAEHPGVGVVRVGGKAETETLGAMNLGHLRKVANNQCSAKDPRAAGFLAAWRTKGKARSELGFAQEVLAEALEASLAGGALSSAVFLVALTPAQLYCLVTGAGYGPVSGSVQISGVDLLEKWAEQLAGLRGHFARTGALDEGESFFALVESAPSLVDTGVVDADAFVGATVAVGKKGMAPAAPALPRLRDVVREALQRWVADIDCADARSIFVAPPGAADAARRSLLRGGAPVAAASEVEPPAAGEDEPGLDALLRELRAEQELDDDEEDLLPNVDAAAAAPRRRRPRLERTSVAGVIEKLQMCRLFAGAASGGGGGGGGGGGDLALAAFTAWPLRPEFAEEIESEELHEGSIWELTPRGRALLLHRAVKAHAEAVARCVAAALPAFREAAAAEATARAEFDAVVARTACSTAGFGAGVIGMTINGAAKHAALLTALAPQVVIVEEAAEVMEPLLVAALPSSARLLFMAGDHMQLPPRPSYYGFTKSDFKLDVSLFRRLVDANLPHGRLRRQNRMHPRLADIVRAVGAYPNEGARLGYEDSEKVVCMPDRAAHATPSHGPFWAHPVFWWAHRDAEDSKSGGVHGFRNVLEAHRVARAAAWHMANGVHPSRVVVLTPYAAQVALIRGLLKDPKYLPLETIKEALLGLPEGSTSGLGMPAVGGVGGGTAVAGAGAAAVVAAAAEGAAGDGGTPLSPIDAAAAERPRVCTVDEFQGDEADHVILSLVRGGGGKLGFVKDRARLVVAVSRARRSLLVVGHLASFNTFSEDWRKVVRHLSSQTAVGPALPLLCPRHPGAPGALAESAASVPVTSAARPCRLPCGALLRCGHGCTFQACHSDAAHAAMKCRIVRELPPGELASCEHGRRAECCDWPPPPGLPPCTVPCRLLMPCGHPCPRNCHFGSDGDHAAAMHDCPALVRYTYASCKHEVCNVKCGAVNETTTALPPCSAPCTKLAPCGHPCVMACGELCAASLDGGACRTCIEELEQERKAFVAAREEAVRVALESAKANAAAVNGSERGFTLLNFSDPEYERITQHVARTTQPGHQRTLRISCIYKLANGERERAFWEAAGAMNDVSLETERLFHGTSKKSVSGIMGEGFRVRRARDSPGASHAQNMLGAAVYLCPDASKAANPEYLKGTKGVLLLCDVLLGSKPKVVVDADPSLDDPERRRDQRYDSVMMRHSTVERKTAVLYDEYAVYDPRLVLPRYSIYVEVLPGAPTKPLAVVPEIVDGAEFYDITFEDVVRAGLNSDSAEAHHFFKAQGLCAQLATQPNLRLTKVTYCRNPRLEAIFEKAKETLKNRQLPDAVEYFFHGTAEANIRPIQLGGFKMPGVNVGHATDTGWWGKGLYLGVKAEVSMGYAKGSKMLLVATLGGRRSDRRGTGRALDGQTGLSETEIGADDKPVVLGHFQSYDAKNGEFIVASPVQTLPCYVVHWG